MLSTALGDLANINFVSMEGYRGPDRGFEVSLSDLVALGLVGSLRLRDSARIRWLPAGTLAFAAFFFVSLASTMSARRSGSRSRSTICMRSRSRRAITM